MLVNNAQNKALLNDQSQWYADVEEAQRTGRLARDIQLERHVKQVAPALLPEDEQQLQSKRSKLGKLASEIEQAEAAQSQKVQQWESLLTTRDCLQKNISRAEGELSALESQRAGLLEYCSGNAGDRDGVFKLSSHFGALAGCERAIAFYPGWLESRCAELAKAEADIVEFAKQNGITTL